MAAKSGLLDFLLTQGTTVEFESPSRVVVTVGNTKKSVPVEGTGQLIGGPCPGQSCAIKLGLKLRQKRDLVFQKGSLPISRQVRVKDSTLFGGSGQNKTRLRKVAPKTFRGSFSPGEISGTFIGTLAGKKTGFVDTNASTVTVEVNWQNGTVDVFDGFVLPADKNRPKTRIKTDLTGSIRNRPPSANAGPNQKLECSSPGGTEVELDASRSTDPDDNISIVQWQSIPEGANHPSDIRTVASRQSSTSPVSTKIQLGTTTFRLGVFDSKFQSDFDGKKIEVVDTRPPKIRDFEFNGPPCLWPPNHEYAVLRVGKEFKSVIDDKCDPDPKLVVRSANSDQPENGRGDGDTSNDVVVFPDHVCLRAERQGGDMSGRNYTVHLAARDDSGNTSDPTVRIRVPHDQRPTRRCRVFRGAKRVGDDSSLCDPAAAKKAWEKYRRNQSDAGDAGDTSDIDAGASGAESSSGPPSRACSAAGRQQANPSVPSWCWLGLVVLLGRRRSRDGESKL